MVRRDTDICDAQELFLVSHPQVSKIRSKTDEYKLNRNTVVVSVDDSGIGIDVGFPTTSLKINPQSMRRDVTENFVLRKLASNEHHG
jgi:hypothetical protein